jgi:ABC-type multidrug transport system permease subunit
MAFLSTAVTKDLRRMRRDPLALATSLGIPLVLVTLITLVFSGGQATPQGRLLVADEDKTLLSQALTTAFSREPLAKMLVMETTAREEGRRRMDRGDASALLIVPKGFQDAFLQNHPVQLQLVTNPAQEILPKIVEETLSIVVDGGFYVQKVAAVPLRSLITTGQAPNDETVARASVAFNRISQSLAKYVNPPLIDLDLHVAPEQQATQNIAAIFLPAMLFMGLLFIGNAHALDIWREQAWGTLRRLATTPASLGTLLGGRLISLALILFGVAVAGVAGMRWAAHVPVASVLLATLWLVLSGTAFYLMLVAIAVHASSQRSANVIGNLVVFPLSLLGGSFFPFEMMPDWMARIGRFTPNGWAITQFKAFVAGSAHMKDFAAAAVYMAIAGSLLFLLTVRRMLRLI